MKRHRYRITVEHLAAPEGTPSRHAPLRFEVVNHDDIVSVVHKLWDRGDLPEDAATAFGVGLKLFGEVMLENRDHPLFAAFKPHFASFMKELKKGSTAS